MDHQTCLEQFITTAQALAELGLHPAHAGNLSCRWQDGYLITASGIAKKGLEPAQILHLDALGTPLATPPGLQPSSETGLHLALYAALPEAQVVIHTHPPYATALASSGQAFNSELLEEARLILGQVPILPAFPAGSPELAQAAAALAPGHRALLLAGHGALSWGEDFQQARYRMEALEHSARIMLYLHLWQNHSAF